MHMSGVSSTEYFLALSLADFTFGMIPVVVLTLLLIPFHKVIAEDQLGNFFVVFMLFTYALIQMVHAVSQFFDETETGIKWMLVIFLLGFFLMPFIVSVVFLAIFDAWDNWQTGFVVWYFINPLDTFLFTLLQVSFTDKPTIANGNY